MDLLKQEIMSGSGISWAMCKSAPWPSHISMPASHHSGRMLAWLPQGNMVIFSGMSGDFNNHFNSNLLDNLPLKEF